jgi:hypothetical protein
VSSKYLVLSTLSWIVSPFIVKAAKIILTISCLLKIREWPKLFRELINCTSNLNSSNLHWENSGLFQASKKYVSKELAKEIRVKAEPFIKWLKEAEEESSGGEEEDEDENIEVNARNTC